MSGRFYHGVPTFRPYSITTRIKTVSHTALTFSDDVLLDPIPLQQGLRLSGWGILSISDILLDPIPLQQGLRPVITIILSHSMTFRPYSITTRIKTRSFTLSAAPDPFRPYSITTRIKTE